MTFVEISNLLNMSSSGLVPYCRLLSICSDYPSKIDFSKEILYKIAKAIDNVHKNNEKTKLLDVYFCQKNEVEKNTSERILELRKEHPLVTNDNFFTLTCFPVIDNYEFLTECNNVW